MKATSPAWLALDRRAGDLEAQIYKGMRDRILLGKLPTGQRLPSTRTLASALGVARSTVVEAYERLKAEGYLETRTGSGSRVAAFSAPPLQGQRPAPTPATRRLPEPTSDGMFRSGVPDLADFPHAAWARCLAARSRSLRVHDLGYDDASGIPALREAILEHVSVTRGVLARPEQVLVVPSTRAAIDLLACLLLRPGQANGDVAWVEDPGYLAGHALLRDAGARLVPVPCDAEGMDVTQAKGPPPRLICVTPSHQYPTGSTLSLQRRLALLDVARANGSVVLEDDYDSEFQYGSRPIAALQGIDRSDVVAYLGTFAKVLAPGLRVAYAIVPNWLVQEASTMQQRKGMAVPIHIQAALADFIREGRLRAYLRRMNGKYAERMAATASALRRHCGNVLDIADGSGGLQLATWFQGRGTDDRKVAGALNAEGHGVQAMSQFYLGLPRPGLLFGIARTNPDTVDKVIAGFARHILRSTDQTRSP
ncbi:PLP-dependent aminotransferase family protein [Rhizobiaceae bacterium n13]|uniref:PLP-dependent aminotransferase family protein n=1 Tax=Ferirhizobium litorale TaxID=2927786 RepID=A0AAE3Q9G0_9HYPH|nr:PLP-dependent aminotransferase family protein [Fererhizobium litorale]MDI7860607.1 PLP-dependent aminotransferase family protein [Fererhizobium litorale]MDI7920755.1 PLP-dependent aminotransferase family protein [Fererhizobium litorale]